MPSPKTLLASLASLAAAPLLIAATTADDPYIWLEDIHGEKALEKVEAWNAATMKALTGTPAFETDRARAKAIMDDPAQIAEPLEVMGDTVTNLWRDAEHPRGQWRQTSLASYLAGKPDWKVLIDVDALGKAEGKSWVWHNADCLAPEYRRCLIALSPGGTDADVVREWDRTTGTFVEGGFEVPLAKSNVAWEDIDTLLIGTDWGEGSMTDSGYSRVVRRWKRGQPLAEATLVKEGEASDIAVSPFTQMDGKTRRVFVDRGTSFYRDQLFIQQAPGKLVRTPLPETATQKGIVRGRLLAYLNEPLGQVSAGSVVSWSVADMLAGRDSAPQVVFTPAKGQSVTEVRTTDNAIWIHLLDDVAGKLVVLNQGANGAWTPSEVALPDNATLAIGATADERDVAFVTAESFLQPPTLYAVSADAKVTALQSLPAKFDADQFTVEQAFATSKDGTKVPYFLARKKGSTGPVPLLMHAYGGFRAAQTPTYLTTQPYRAGPLALYWLEDGEAYVLANIRGGDEYGPAWHDAALREKRQNAYDDLYAVAEDLVSRGVTAKGKIAVSGRSNGGLLAGVAMTQRPDLFGAAIIGSPLLDMKRYNQLLAGASWMAEYGNPDVPEDWAFISKYSPYQALKQGVSYPAPFFYLSTEDDRVHPGHARKMAARLEEYGQPFYYHEYREGGHSVGADHAEDAVRAALLHAYLKATIGAE
ncbi:prolyl oligopeptidase family serine peptidase [Novosphingobium aquimarinum]|uniref:prolyl oligopeptidase family serine peptidase n=1 Tax=Novosphingobium aquimarinum TaxID=2682494 RepID=UPI0012EB730F|nr:prolyl oligopeptidase family serine peptidase [Novosphingobium aquimarinum]